MFADCDLDQAVEGTAKSAFANCGQVCLGTERIYVERSIFSTFVERLKIAAQALRPADPFDKSTTLGPLISEEHRTKVLSYYQRAVADGAQIVTGGGVPRLNAPFDGGSWIEPTIWVGLPEDLSVVREEIFGPCCHVCSFDSEEEAVALANDSPYGLAAAIWTRDLARAHRVAAQVDVGITWVNSWFLRATCARHSAEQSSRASAAKVECTPWNSTRNYERVHQALRHTHTLHNSLKKPEGRIQNAAGVRAFKGGRSSP